MLIRFDRRPAPRTDGRLRSMAVLPVRGILPQKRGKIAFLVIVEYFSVLKFRTADRQENWTV